MTVTDDLAARMLSLPMYDDMPDDEMTTIAAVVSPAS